MKFISFNHHAFQYCTSGATHPLENAKFRKNTDDYSGIRYALQQNAKPTNV